MKDGILTINKPQNMTSHDVVAILRKVLGMKRIGHTGTLDPMATGVLPVCLGNATRIMEYLDLDFKTYRCRLRLGMTTDTLDVWGEKTGEYPVDKVTEEDIRQAFSRFQGEILQKPPMYSAVRVNGKRLYEYARAGQQIEVKYRKIFIDRLEIEEIDLSKMEITFTVTCSKGTYIRTICQDIGEILKTGAVMTALVRLSCGRFTLKEAATPEEIKNMKPEEIEERLLPCDFPLIHFGKAVLSPDTGRKFINGWHIPIELCHIEKEPEFQQKDPPFFLRPEYKRAYNLYQRVPADPPREDFLGVAFYHPKDKKFIADKVFFRGTES